MAEQIAGHGLRRSFVARRPSARKALWCDTRCAEFVRESANGRSDRRADFLRHGPADCNVFTHEGDHAHLGLPRRRAENRRDIPTITDPFPMTCGIALYFDTKYPEAEPVVKLIEKNIDLYLYKTLETK